MDARSPPATGTVLWLQWYAIDTIDPNGVTQRAVYNNRGQLIEQIKDRAA
jgi:YD repeat-containing protein